MPKDKPGKPTPPLDEWTEDTPLLPADDDDSWVTEEIEPDLPDLLTEETTPLESLLDSTPLAPLEAFEQEQATEEIPLDELPDLLGDPEPMFTEELARELPELPWRLPLQTAEIGRVDTILAPSEAESVLYTPEAKAPTLQLTLQLPEGRVTATLRVAQAPETQLVLGRDILSGRIVVRC